MTMMYSPIGGWNNAFGAEIADLKKLGWFQEGEEGYVDPKGKKAEPKAEPKVVVGEKPTLAEQYEAKFGKPPHHRMKLETIEAALKE